MTEKLYPPQSLEGLENWYFKHVEAMTREGLHSKSDIAAQLAWRDREIARLKAENEALREVVERARKRQWLCELRPDNEAEARNQASMIILANQALSAALAKLDALEAKKEKQS